MDRGDWLATGHGVKRSWTQPKRFTTLLAWHIHIVVQRKVTHFKAVILQLKINKITKKKRCISV